MGIFLQGVRGLGLPEKGKHLQALSPPMFTCKKLKVFQF
jgi:hypothetical protein